MTLIVLAAEALIYKTVWQLHVTNSRSWCMHNEASRCGLIINTMDFVVTCCCDSFSWDRLWQQQLWRKQSLIWCWLRFPVTHFFGHSKHCHRKFWCILRDCHIGHNVLWCRWNLPVYKNRRNWYQLAGVFEDVVAVLDMVAGIVQIPRQSAQELLPKLNCSFFFNFLSRLPKTLSINNSKINCQLISINFYSKKKAASWSQRAKKIAIVQCNILFSQFFMLRAGENIFVTPTSVVSLSFQKLALVKN